MPDRYVERAKENMGALERLFSGLPGIQGYREKELRRDADSRLRETIARDLTDQQQRLNSIQRTLMSGGLTHLDDVDRLITRLQTLADQVRAASEGYAGLFDAVKVQDEQLRALHSFDVALAGRVAVLQNDIDELQEAASSGDDDLIRRSVSAIDSTLHDLSATFERRRSAILDTDLLMDTDIVPDVDEETLEKASAESTQTNA